MTAPQGAPREQRSFGKRIWASIEESQGFGFIGDDVCGYTDDEAYQIAKAALSWERETVKRLAALIRSYESARDRRITKASKGILDRAALTPHPTPKEPT